jgi:hypothetical protein
MTKATIKDSMFIAWMDANKKYSDAKELTYTQFVSKFVSLKEVGVGVHENKPTQ